MHFHRLSDASTATERSWDQIAWVIFAYALLWHGGLEQALTDFKLLPVHAGILFLGMTLGLCGLLYLQLRANAHQWQFVLATIRRFRVPILCLALLALLSYPCALLPGANWRKGGIYVFSWTHNLIALLAGIAIASRPSHRAAIRIALFIALGVLIAGNVLGAVAPSMAAATGSRVGGALRSVNVVPQIICVGLPALLHYERFVRRDALLLGFCFAGVVLNLSRAGAATVALVTAIWACWHYGVRIAVATRRKLATAAVALGLCMTLGPLAIAILPQLPGMDNSNAYQRIQIITLSDTKSNNASGQLRADSTSEGMVLLQSAPLGHGTGYNRARGLGLHNMFLAVGADLGVLGIGLFTLMLVSALAIFSTSMGVAGITFTFVILLTCVVSHNIGEARFFLVMFGYYMADQLDSATRR